MKFNLGEWRMKPGYTAYNCEQVRTIRISPDKTQVELFMVPYHYDYRSMDGPAQHMYISAPQKDMIRIKTVHFLGSKDNYPRFEIDDQNLPLDILETDEKYVFGSGDMTFEIKKSLPVEMNFYYKGKPITGIGSRFGSPVLSYITTPEGPFMRGQLNVDVGEKIYGLGERFTPFVRNGQVIDIWNEDGGTSSEISYKNIPFYMSSNNYGVLVNDAGPVSFEVCSEATTKVQFSVPGQSLDFIVIGADTRKDVLKKYTDLTGKPGLPPAWTFGLWLTSSFTTSYDEKTVTSFTDGMKDRGIPLSVFHFDCYWMKENEWCGFEWDKDMFPDPEGLLERLHNKGLRVCVWINPYIGDHSPVWKEAADAGYLLKKPNGDVWQWDLWQAGCSVVDFTNPGAVEWYKNKLRRLIKQGVDCFKTDFGERIPTDVVYYDGSDPERMHNYYTYLYNKAVYEVLAEMRGEKDACLFARSATVGGQKFPVHWGGDCNSTYVSMAESLRGGLGLCLSGFGYWSHDMGGFEGTAPADVYKRWLAFGLLSSHSRLHGSNSYRVPWLFGEEAVDVCRRFSKLKNRLMPYLYSLAVEAHTQGVPVMRAMLLEFDDIACEDLDRQYMLGDALLVAPVMRENGTVDYYLPEGNWTHLLTGETVKGGGWRRDTYDFFSLPLYVRSNTILPMGANDESPEYDYAEGLTLKLYNIEDGATVKRIVNDMDGNEVLSAVVTRNGDLLNIELNGSTENIKVAQIGTDCMVQIRS